MKTKKKEKKGKQNLLQRYNNSEAKKSVKFSAMKTGVDLVVGASAGAGLGALLGIWSPLAGFLMLGAGHYFGDKSGVLRVAGAATIAYGIAKAQENRVSAENASVNGISLGSITEGAKNRLINFKNNWLQAFYLDKVIGSKTPTEDPTVGDIDVSALDVFDDLNKKEAIKYELQRIQQEEDSANDPLKGLEDEVNEMNYSIIEEDFDYSTL